MHFHPYASNLDCIYEAKLLRIASKRDKSSIFTIKHCFSAKSANYCDFKIGIYSTRAPAGLGGGKWPGANNNALAP